MLGRPLFDLYPDLTARGTHEYYEDRAVGSHHRHFSGAASLRDWRCRSTNANLSFTEMPQSGRIGPLSSDGEIIGTVTILEDVSDRLASEANCGRRSKRSRSRAPRRSRLSVPKTNSSRRCHTKSVRPSTPCSAGPGFSGRQDIDRPLLDRAVQVIERNAAAQAKMIDDMLDMARIVQEGAPRSADGGPAGRRPRRRRCRDAVGERQADRDPHPSGTDRAAGRSAITTGCSRWCGTCCRTL